MGMDMVTVTGTMGSMGNTGNMALMGIPENQTNKAESCHYG